jgi:hypothetical protein
VISKYAVTAVSDIKRDVFIRLFTGGAAVFIPDINGLAVFDKRPEPFPETVNQLADGKVQLFTQVCFLVRRDRISGALDTVTGDAPAVIQVICFPGVAFEIRISSLPLRRKT